MPLAANSSFAPSVPSQPSRAGRTVVAFGASLAVLAYIDRVAISQAAPLIARDLHFDKAKMGIVFSVFLLSYSLFEVPGAWYGDIVGARKALLRIVAAWSLFTALTGWAWGFASMVTIRFMFGVGEAGCFPVIAKSFREALPPESRTRAQSILWLAARWGGAFTPLLVVWVLRFVNWRMAFVVFGSLGVLWALWFAGAYPRDPLRSPQQGSKEGEAVRGTHSVPWGKLLRSRSVLLLSLQYFFVSFSWYFYLTWLPTYLQEHHKLSPAVGATYAVFPLFFCGIGSLFCGFASPTVNRWTGSVGRTRRIMAMTGFAGAGMCLAVATQMSSVNATMAMMSAACFFNDQIIPHSWAACMDIGGKAAASSVAGTMNVMGNLAGTASSLLGGLILEYSSGNWNLFILVLAGVYFLGLFCWPLIDSETPLEGV